MIFKHKKVQYLLFIWFSAITFSAAQVSINTDGIPADSSSMLDVRSNSKGLLIPRITEADRDAINGPAHSLMIYQTDGTSGYYFNNGTAALPVWTPLGGGSGENNSRIPIDTIPFTISSSGSYYLTQSFNGSGTDNGITISASNVTIDLNGYSLTGDGTATLHGIISSGPITMVRIYNGFISNWTGYGVSLTSASNCAISYLSAMNCGFAGVFLGDNSEAIQVKASGNGFDGISTANDCTIANCLSNNNSFDGIDVGSNCKVLSSTATSNGDNGFESSNSVYFESNIADNNTNNGFYLGAGSTTQNCTSSNNINSGYELNTACSAYNCKARANSGNGFIIESDAIVFNNSADNNYLSGFLIDSADARIEGNHSTDNSQHGFNVTGTGNLILRNSASGNGAVNFNIGVSNTAGTVLTIGTFNSNTNPFANFSF